jgi:hypothetical protein
MLSVMAMVAITVLSTTAVAAEAPAEADPLTEADVRALLPGVSAAVEKIRGLSFKRPVGVKVIAAEEVLAIMESRQQAGDEHRFAQKAGVQLGLLPEGGDLKATYRDALKATLNGWYDADTDALYMTERRRPSAVVALTLAHELTHALDHQHFPWSASYKAVRDDQRLAFTALIEGSAVNTVGPYVRSEIRAGRLTPSVLTAAQAADAQPAPLASTPLILQRAATGPYLLGPFFLRRGVSGRPVGAPPDDINRAFENPPESTEQLLHPEKYWDLDKYDAPRTVELPDLSSALGEGWTLKKEGVIGELGLAILTEATSAGVPNSDPHDVSHWTNAGASGWGGDRYHYYESDAGSATLLASVWDSEADAQEFEASVVRRPPKVVKRRGNSVVCIAASPDVKTERLLASAFEALEKKASP